MNGSDQQNDYTKFYLTRQEQIAIDQFKKIIDLEVKLTMVIENTNALGAKYEEALKTIETQQDVISQATVSIENLTNTKNDNDRAIKDLNDDFVGALTISYYKEPRELHLSDWILVRSKVGAIGSILTDYLHDKS